MRPVPSHPGTFARRTWRSEALFGRMRTDCPAAQGRNGMLKRLLIATIATFSMNAACATNAACEAQATEKNLSGAARTSFMTKCEKDAAAAVTKSCKENATAKKLSGAARTSYVTKCEKDTLEATESCAAQATDKKLSGAARSSFTKKCVSDATAATR